MSKLLSYSKYPLLGLLSLIVMGVLVIFGAYQAQAQAPKTTPTASPAAVSDESCIACHTDKEQLQATVSEEEMDTESLSEGEG
jgi:mono/diheme cytochrome c family protein